MDGKIGSGEFSKEICSINSMKTFMDYPNIYSIPGKYPMVQ